MASRSRRRGRVGAALLAVGLVVAAGCDRSSSDAAPTAIADAGTKDAFAREVLTALEAATGPGKFTYDRERFALIGASGDGNVLFLANLFDEVTQAPPPERRERIARFVGIALRDKPVPPTLEAARAALLPIVRDRMYFEHLALLAEPGARTPPAALRVIAESLAIAPALDDADTIRPLATGDLEAWKVDFDAAMRPALENLRRKSVAAFESIGPGACESTWHDDYDGARMLLDDVLARCEVRGDVVVATPNRATLLVAGADDPTALAALADRIEVGLKAPRANAGRAYRRTAGVWAPFLPSGPPALARRFEAFELDAKGRDYAEQKEALERRLAKEKKDIFVAKFVIATSKSGASFSYGTWTRGVDTYLPVAEYVAFIDPERPKAEWFRGRARLADVRKLPAPAALRPLGTWPERLVTEGFPTPEELAKLVVKDD
jgi:hypothetical protein